MIVSWQYLFFEWNLTGWIAARHMLVNTFPNWSTTNAASGLAGMTVEWLNIFS
jgi:hypothetical protein